MKFPYSRPSLDDNDIAEAIKVLKRQFLTQGPVVEELETILAQAFGAKYAVVCNSATAALHMCYISLGLGPENGLITSPISFLSTATAALMCGAKVGFADVCAETGNVTLSSIQAAVEKANFKVGAITIVHLGGRPCKDVEKISSFASSIGAYLIEDACHAPKAGYSDASGKKFTVGRCSHSEAATFSFHAIKHITTGEGGAILTNNKQISEKARLIRSHGISRPCEKLKLQGEVSAPWYYEARLLGYNYRLSDINCALALNQISKLSENLIRRHAIAKLYHKLLGKVEGVTLPTLINPEIGQHSWHLFSPSFDFDQLPLDRKNLMTKMADRGIQTQVHYIPLYRQPILSNFCDVGELPGAEKYYDSTLSLPMYYGLTDDDIGEICRTLLFLINK